MTAAQPYSIEEKKDRKENEVREERRQDCISPGDFSDYLVEISDTLSPFTEQIKHLAEMLNSTYGCMSSHSSSGDVSGITTVSSLLKMLVERMDESIDKFTDPENIRFS